MIYSIFIFQILVWHTRTHGVAKSPMKIDLEKFKGTNMVALEKQLKNVLKTIP